MTDELEHIRERFPALRREHAGRPVAYFEALSVGLGMVSGFLGMVISYYIDVASGATIVMFQAALFGLVLAITSIHKQAERRLIHTHV